MARNWVMRFRGLTDTRGQDLIEYALLVSLVATSVGATVPSVATDIHTVFSKVASVVANAAGKNGPTRSRHDD